MWDLSFPLKCRIFARPFALAPGFYCPNPCEEIVCPEGWAPDHHLGARLVTYGSETLRVSVDFVSPFTMSCWKFQDSSVYTRTPPPARTRAATHPCNHARTLAPMPSLADVRTRRTPIHAYTNLHRTGATRTDTYSTTQTHTQHYSKCLICIVFGRFNQVQPWPLHSENLFCSLGLRRPPLVTPREI